MTIVNKFELSIVYRGPLKALAWYIGEISRLLVVLEPKTYVHIMQGSYNLCPSLAIAAEKPATAKAYSSSFEYEIEFGFGGDAITTALYRFSLRMV